MNGLQVALKQHWFAAIQREKNEVFLNWGSLTKNIQKTGFLPSCQQQKCVAGRGYLSAHPSRFRGEAARRNLCPALHVDLLEQRGRIVLDRTSAKFNEIPCAVKQRTMTGMTGEALQQRPRRCRAQFDRIIASPARGRASQQNLRAVCREFNMAPSWDRPLAKLRTGFHIHKSDRRWQLLSQRSDAEVRDSSAVIRDGNLVNQWP